MMLVEETPVPTTALPVAELKAHLRLGSGFADDSLQDSVLESFLRAALAAIEARTGKVLLERAFAWSLEAWRDDAAQPLPVAPVSDISEVTLVDRNGTGTVVAPSAYRLVQDLHAPKLAPMGSCLPTIPHRGQAEIRFSAGFGAEWGAIPPDLAQAVLLLAAHYYEYREDTGLKGGCMPFGVTSLIERYRPMRLGFTT
ncbi:head-tail connector protein [Shimia biformata]|uniref:head-tail connector protein n=1 Tax=Shimia biformata TaxID=1294299 RepID=UPI0019509D65|nr:head-tail connector protein [Shimia biformata]